MFITENYLKHLMSTEQVAIKPAMGTMDTHVCSMEGQMKCLMFQRTASGKQAVVQPLSWQLQSYFCTVIITSNMADHIYVLVYQLYVLAL